MKLLQKRPVAAAVMVLAILAGIALGQAKKPDTEAALTGEFLYLIHNEQNIIFHAGVVIILPWKEFLKVMIRLQCSPFFSLPYFLL